MDQLGKRRMYLHRRDAHAAEHGFSLMELLVVLVILALLMGLVAPRVIGYLSRAKDQTAQAQIQMIDAALDMMLIDLGRYPTQEEGLKLLVENPGDVAGWAGPYLKKGKLPDDPWGRPYLMRLEESGEVTVYSLGADGAEGGEGDDKDIGFALHDNGVTVD